MINYYFPNISRKGLRKIMLKVAEQKQAKITLGTFYDSFFFMKGNKKIK